MSIFPQPSYCIQNGVRRALIARELGQTTIKAVIYRDSGKPHEQEVALSQLFSLKTDPIDRDERYNKLKLSIEANGQQRPIELEPLGVPGQPAAIPLSALS